MYSKPFYITNPVWNNVFSYDKRSNKEIFVTSLIEGDFSDVQIWDKPAFIELNEDWEEKIYFGLKNFIKSTWKNVPVYIFDNHNHAFYFWHEALAKWVIGKWSKLVHIDEHNDTREPGSILTPGLKLPISKTFLKRIFNYTNFNLNVWNYIVPAMKSWLIPEVIKITWESDLFFWENKELEKDYILNLDLDIFSDELDYVNFDLKKDIILKFAKKAKIITIASSPYFIDQKKAIEILKKIFEN